MGHVATFVYKMYAHRRVRRVGWATRPSHVDWHRGFFFPEAGLTYPHLDPTPDWEQNMISLSRDGRQTLFCMLCLNSASISFCANRFKSGRPTDPLKLFFRMAEIEFKQKSNWIRSCKDGDGQNKFVALARGDFSSLQFFRIAASAVDLFRSAAKLV